MSRCKKCQKCMNNNDFCPDCVNRLADLVIQGRYGNGEERKNKLGSWYAPVQNEVNRRLGYSKRHQY